MQVEQSRSFARLKNLALAHIDFFFSRARCTALANHPQHTTESLKNYTDTRPSATARSIAGGTVGRLELDREPRMHIFEERSKENPKLHRSQPITTEYGVLHFLLNKCAKCL